MRALWGHFDERSIVVFRLTLGLVTLLDWTQRALEIPRFYLESGALPVASLRLYQAQSWFTLLNWIQNDAAIYAFFALEGLLILLFLQGRFAQLIKLPLWICVLSIVTRAHLTLNGGDYLLCIWWFWALFVPFSRAQATGAKDKRTGASAPNDAPALISSPFAFMLVWQLALIYFFNAVHKTGWNWRDGSAVWYFLHLERKVTFFGIFLRETLPASAFRLGTYSALCIEAMAPLLLLSPFNVKEARLGAIVLLSALHLGILATVHVGNFSLVVLCVYPLLLRPEHWDGLETWSKDRRWSSGFSRLRLPRATPLPLPLVRQVISWAGAGTILFFINWDALLENQFIRARWRAPPLPERPNAVLQSLKLQQQWQMFSPTAPVLDTRLVIEFEIEAGVFVDYETAGDLPPGPNNARVYRQNSMWERYGSALERRLYYPQRALFQKWIVEESRKFTKSGEPALSISAYYVAQEAPNLRTRHAPGPCFGDLYYWPHPRAFELRSRQRRMLPMAHCSWL